MEKQIDLTGLKLVNENHARQKKQIKRKQIIRRSVGILGIVAINVFGIIGCNAINATETRNQNAEIMIPITDFSEVYIGEDDYPHFVLRDYGNVADDPNNISYAEIIKQINNGIQTEMQKHIIRYGYAYNDGSTIVTEDGNTWCLEDAPCFDEGTSVRVLFDSNETYSVEDDIILDITERRE